MDVQKTMKFILEQQAQFAAWRTQHQTEHGQINAAIASLAATVDKLADNINRLDQVMETLAEAQIQNQERFRDTDARIAALVPAIGEFLGRQKN